MKKKMIKIGAVFALLLAGAAYMDGTVQGDGGDNRILRQPTGEGSREYVFNLEAEEVIDNYTYTLRVEEELPDQEQIMDYLAQAEQEIEESFWPEGEDASGVSLPVQPKESYVGGLVEAEWSFDRYDVIDASGALLDEEIPEEGAIVTAYVQLGCYGVQEAYQFSFLVQQREKTQEESLLADIGTYIAEQQELTGERYLQLPDEMDGVLLKWTKEKPHYLWKMILLELVLLPGLILVKRERKKNLKKQRIEQMQLDYPEIVSKILILNGAGMSIKQVWNRICCSYLQKKKCGQIETKPSYEEMVVTNRAMMDGESERAALQRFGERTGIGCYHRLSRLLAENLHKGSKGMDSQLEREAEDAFEQRKTMARKLGEEAATKMLFPMILMLGIVLAIVLVPAFIGFGN